MSERMSDSRSFEVLTEGPVRLSSSPARSYRSWSDEEKARIVGGTLVAGANVSAIARSNGLDPSQLFAWRRKAKGSGVMVPLAAAASGPVKFARFKAARSNMVEIAIGDVVVRASGDVEPNRLADVIRAVRKA
ncbi:transposase [Bradyrhizobium sp. B120]|uniref:transposase n=1 Tax=Bradyrhizobium sp. B120 TaxID=3410088 RepID=UPI003B982D5F